MSESTSVAPEVEPEPEALRTTDQTIHPTDQTTKLSEVHEKPSGNWETAYIWAFISKFTSLSQDVQIGLRIQNVMNFESALEKDDHEIMTAIVKIFHENLKITNTSNWERWLTQYVDSILKGKHQIPMYTLFNWEENYLKTRPDGFWGLNCEEKVHLLRTLVDHQMAFSAGIRATIDETYEKATAKPAKPAKNSAAANKADGDLTEASKNPLLIRPLGMDRDMKTWWQIDESPRMYCSGNPHKSSCTWGVLSSTEGEVIAAQGRLDRDPSLLPAPTSPNGNEVQTKTRNKPKGKVPAIFLMGSKNGQTPDAKEDYLLKQEWQLNKAIDDVVKPKIELGKRAIQKILEEKTRLEGIEARRQRRLAGIEEQKIRNAVIAEEFSGGLGGRLRTQVHKPDYVVDSAVTDREFERELREFEKQPSSRRHNERKRRKAASNDDDTDAGDESWNEAGLEQDDQDNDAMDIDEDDDFDGTSGPGRDKRATKKNAGRAKRQKHGPSISKVPLVGERRSSRVKKKVVVEEEVAEEDVPQAEAAPEPAQSASSSAWSRAQPLLNPLPNSPSRSERSEKSGVPSELDGNVSVWSRGKLVYVAGENKYASKPVALPPRRDSITTSGSGLAVRTSGTAQDCTSEGAGQSVASGKSNSLAALQARLASMGNNIDDGSDSEAGTAKHSSTSAINLDRTVDGKVDGDSKPDNNPLSSLFDTDEPPISKQMTGDLVP